MPPRPDHRSVDRGGVRHARKALGWSTSSAATASILPRMLSAGRRRRQWCWMCANSSPAGHFSPEQKVTPVRMTMSQCVLRGSMRWWRTMCLAILAGWLVECAASVGPHGEVPPGGPDEVSVSFPPYNGPKRRVQVVQIRIPAEDLKGYPELAEKRVGFGLSNILLETLYDTNRFTFLEEKEQVLKRLVDLWELTADGILVKNRTMPETE